MQAPVIHIIHPFRKCRRARLSDNCMCVQERYQAREAILEMRENAVAAKEEQALVTEASHASCVGPSATEAAASPSTAHG